jgi:hypothetical protein
MKRYGIVTEWVSGHCLLILVVAVAFVAACQASNRSAASESANQAPESRSTIQPSQLTASGQEAAKPDIQITLVPPSGGGPDRLERIAGTVSGVNLKECKCKVVIFALTNVWWVQPFADSPDTSIDGNGRWENDTHLGREYAALLVKNSYKPRPTTSELPQVGGDVLAADRERAKE